MRQPLRLKPIRGRQLNRLRQLDDPAKCPRLRRRVPMVVLVQAGAAPTEAARMTRQSSLTVGRWPHRFEAEGWAGLVGAPGSGRPPVIRAALETFFREVVVRSPRDFGLARPGWATALLARLVRRHLKRSVTAEWVRQPLAQVCRRPPWAVKHRAKEEPGYAPKKAGLPGFCSPPRGGGRVRRRRGGVESVPHAHPDADAARPAAQDSRPRRPSTQVSRIGGRGLADGTARLAPRPQAQPLPPRREVASPLSAPPASGAHGRRWRPVPSTREVAPGAPALPALRPAPEAGLYPKVLTTMTGRLLLN